jgi:hypothetical protein
MRRKAIALTFILGLLCWGITTTRLSPWVKGNAFPPRAEPYIMVTNPQNATYHVDAIAVNFTIASNYYVFSSFYSFDGQGIEPIENLTVISQEDINAGRNPSVIKTVLNGSLVLSNLTEGWHNITFYLINQHENIHERILSANYEVGEIVCKSKPLHFNVDLSEEPAPATIMIVSVSLSSATIVGIGLLVYFKKRKH